MKSKCYLSTSEYMHNQFIHAVTRFGLHISSLSSLKSLTCATKCQLSTRHRARMPSDCLLSMRRFENAKSPHGQIQKTLDKRAKRLPNFDGKSTSIQNRWRRRTGPFRHVPSHLC